MLLLFYYAIILNYVIFCVTIFMSHRHGVGLSISMWLIDWLIVTGVCSPLQENRPVLSSRYRVVYPHGKLSGWRRLWTAMPLENERRTRNVWRLSGRNERHYTPSNYDQIHYPLLFLMWKSCGEWVTSDWQIGVLSCLPIVSRLPRDFRIKMRNYIV